MGEAKRRKQQLGENYGKQTQLIIRGGEDLEQHVERFFEAWYQYLESLMPISEEIPPEENPAEEPLLNPTEVAENQEKTRQWIHDYIQAYRLQDQNKLVCGILDPTYEELLRMFEDQEKEEKTDEERIEEVMTWMIEATSYFGLLKSYLSAENVEKYKEPLQSFYETVLAESEANQDEESISFLKSMFAESLDLQEAAG
jgi:hypothetical protein